MSGAGRERIAPAAARLSTLAAATVLSAVSPVLYIPVVSQLFGAGGWSAVAVGQSVGAAGAILVAFGWVFDGARRLAGRSAPHQAAVLQEALASQLYLAVPVAAVTSSAALFSAPAHTGAAALSAVAATVVGLSPAWFFVARGSAGHLLLLDALPRCLGSVVGTGLLLGGYDLWVLPAAQLGVSFAALLIAVRIVTGRSGLPLRSLSPRRVLRTVRTQRLFALTQVSSAVYINLPTLVIAWVSPPSLALFAATDRLFRLGVTALSPLTQFTQSWVPKVEEERPHRMRVAMVVHLAVGVVGAAVFVVGTPVAQELLFRNAVALSLPVTMAYAVLLPVVMVTQAIGFNVLALSGRAGALAGSAVCGAVVAVVAIPTLGVAMGALGGALGVLAAECSVLVWQVRAGRRQLGRTRSG